jgi:hypothetical protein
MNELNSAYILMERIKTNCSIFGMPETSFNTTQAKTHLPPVMGLAQRYVLRQPANVACAKRHDR